MFKNFINLIYPRLCASCRATLKEGEKTICVFCLSELPRSSFYLDQDNPVAKLFWGKVKLETAIASFVFVKKGKIQQLMHELKYKGTTEVGEVLGVELGKDLQKVENLLKIDYVIPVPLHPKKLKIRGYNQSDYIAFGVAKVLGSSVGDEFFIRNKHSESQTKKSKYERWENVGSIFNIDKIEELENKHVLIVDDVVTTGSTIEACCKALENVKGVKISVATLAFA